MKKNTLTTVALLICAAIAGLLTSCTKNYGEPVTTNYAIDGTYTKLDISHGFDVTVSDDVTEAVVTIPEKLHSKLKLNVKDGVLSIGFTTSFIITNSDLTVVLPRNAELKDLNLSGASSFHGDLNGTSSDVELSGASNFYGNITAAEVDFEISGASSYNGTVNCDKVDSDISGSSEVTINGVCTGTMDFDISGSSNLNAIYFNTDAVTGDLSGSSNADVTVCSRIAVNVSGASELTYGTSSPNCHPDYGCTSSGSSTIRPR